MREILFRGKYIDNGEWIEGYPLFEKDDVLIMRSIEGEHKGFEFMTVFEDTISEFTGLYDKNGNRIFEGDILRHSYWHGNEKKSRNICVRFLNGAFCWSTSADNDENCFAFADSEMYGINTEKDCEVIGNIFDNRELLEE